MKYLYSAAVFDKGPDIFTGGTHFNRLRGWA